MRPMRLPDPCRSPSVGGLFAGVRPVAGRGPGPSAGSVVRHRATWRWRPGYLLHRAAARAWREPRRRRRAAAPPSSPFGLAVTPAGAVLYDVNLELPEAPDLTPFPGATTLVAWAATPQFDSEMRLGEVRPGVTRVRRIPFNRFLVLVSAEPSARVTERTGRVLLRGSLRRGAHAAA